MDYKSKYTGYQVEQLLDKADTALQSYTEQYKGTVTGVKINGTTKNPSSGVVDLGTVITAHQTLKTINGESILGSGNITIEGGSSDANVQAVDTGDVLDDVNIEYATTAYVDNKVANINLTDYATITYVNGLIGDINSVLESIINGGPSINLISITVNDFYTGTSYVCQAEEGMTWVDWINSKYNTYGWYISDGYIFLSDGLTLAFQGAPFTESVLTGYVMEDGAVGFHTYDLDSNN